MSAEPTLDLNNTTPAAPANGILVQWQSTSATSDPRSVSAALVGPGTSGYFLKADGTWGLPFGITVSGTPASGKVLTATSPTTATWQTPSAGGGGLSSLLGARRIFWVTCGDGTGVNNTWLGDAVTSTGVFNSYLGPVFASSQGPNTSCVPSVANTFCGTRTLQKNYWYGANLNYCCGCFITRITDVRMWVGLVSLLATSFGDTLTGSSASGVAFRFSTIAGDTNYKCVTSNGTTQTVVDSGVAADTKQHTFVVLCTDTGTPSAAFYIDGVLVATITTTLPTAGLLLGWQAGAQYASAAPGSFLFGFSHAETQSDY